MATRRGTERWPSGLRRTLGERVTSNGVRGFESHSLRHRGLAAYAFVLFVYIVCTRYKDFIVLFVDLKPFFVKKLKFCWFNIVNYSLF